MNKIFGLKSDFALVKNEKSSVVISYDYEEVNGTDNAKWREVVFYKKQVAKPTIEQVVSAINAAIDKQTEEKILTGFVWKKKKIWLSKEFQKNISDILSVTTITKGKNLPLKLKVGEAELTPIYHTFESADELKGFYVDMVNYIHQCLEEGWEKKDSIEWTEYIEELRELDAE